MMTSAFYVIKFDSLGPVITQKDATWQPRGSATWKPRGGEGDVAGATWQGPRGMVPRGIPTTCHYLTRCDCAEKNTLAG